MNEQTMHQQKRREEHEIYVARGLGKMGNRCGKMREGANADWDYAQLCESAREGEEAEESNLTPDTQLAMH